MTLKKTSIQDLEIESLQNGLKIHQGNKLSSKQIIVIIINYNKPVGTITNRLNQAEEST